MNEVEYSASSSAGSLGVPGSSDEIMVNKAAACFPEGFIWGCSTSAHQIEGDNVNSDMWAVENATPTLFKEPSGKACNSLEMWPADLDLVKQLGLGAYRFSLEWARIEPEPGVFSDEVLEHYKSIVEACRERGIAPVVTFCHFSIPRWFAGMGAWTNPESADLFSRYCAKAASYLADGIEYAVTINEANLGNFLYRLLPANADALIAAMNSSAGEAYGMKDFTCGLLVSSDQNEIMQKNLIAAHKAGKRAIKSVRGDLPVGVSLSVTDHQEACENSVRDKMRSLFYGSWFDVAKDDDFVGVQNYSRLIWGETEKVAPPEGAKFNQLGLEIYPPSLAGAVRHVYEATGTDILITEHGLPTSDDSERAEFIQSSLRYLQQLVSEGVPVKGYCHWSLLDNFEWMFGYSQQYGLCTVDRNTFERNPKPSAFVLRDIAVQNAVS